MRIPFGVDSAVGKLVHSGSASAQQAPDKWVLNHSSDSYLATIACKVCRYRAAAVPAGNPMLRGHFDSRQSTLAPLHQFLRQLVTSI